MQHINKYFRAFDTKKELNLYSFNYSREDINNILSIPTKDTVKFIKDNEDKYLYLAYANLVRADLVAVNLSYANFYKSNLYKSNLSFSSLNYANCKEVNFIGAILKKVSYRGTDFTDADFKGIDESSFTVL